MATTKGDPNLQEGIEYWNNQPANLDGVLGGFGSGSLPRIDALGSRQFLLYLLPELCTVPSALRPLDALPLKHRIRALDVGAGIGRVTSDVLLRLVFDVVLLEPVEKFVLEAWNKAKASESAVTPTDEPQVKWKGIREKSKSVTFLRGTLQDFNPSNPRQAEKATFIGRVGYVPEKDDAESGFDVIWCQWCLGHLNDVELVSFLKKCRAALRDIEPIRSVIIVKENVCSNTKDGGPNAEFDKQDSTLTRSDALWKKLFKQANLNLVREKVQLGLEAGLYEVCFAIIRASDQRELYESGLGELSRSAFTQCPSYWHI